MIDERAKATVELDGRQAKDELAELRDRAKEYRKELREMTEKNDLAGVKELEKKLQDVNKEMAAARKTTFDYNQVLRNLSGSTIKELERTQSALTKEIKNTTRGTDEYIKKTKQLSQVRSEINKTRGDMNQFTTTQSKITGLLTKSVGLLGGFYGAVKIGQGIIEASEAASDKWAVTMGELNSMWDYLKKSISTVDFKNFWENMGKAAEFGREYARQKDEIEDRNRAISMRESEITLQILEQTKIYKNVLISENERMAAIDKIISLEKELATVRKDIDKQAWNAKVAEIGKYGITEDILMANLKNYEVNKDLIGQAEEYAKSLNKIKNAKTSVSTPYGTQEYDISQEEKTKQILALNMSTNDTVIKFAETRAKYTKLNAAELDELVQLYINLTRAEINYEENTMRAAAKKSQLIKEMNGDREKQQAAGNKLGAESPLYAIDKANTDDLEKAGKDLDAYAEWVLDIITDSEDTFLSKALTNDEILAKTKIDHIRTNAEYEKEMYEQTLDGKKKVLAKQLKDGKIAEKEYHDAVFEMDLQANIDKAELYASLFGSISLLVKKNSTAYRIAAIGEATASTYAGAARALKDYKWPYNLLVMAAVIASGLAQVNQIRKMSNEGYAWGGYTGHGGKYQAAGIVHKGEYVIPQEDLSRPTVRQFVMSNIEPARIARINSSGAQNAISNMRGYASGGLVTAPQTNNININNDALADQGQRTNQLLETLVNLWASGSVRASFYDSDVEDITARQGVISKIKSSVSRSA